MAELVDATDSKSKTNIVLNVAIPCKSLHLRRLPKSLFFLTKRKLLHFASFKAQGVSLVVYHIAYADYTKGSTTGDTPFSVSQSLSEVTDRNNNELGVISFARYFEEFYLVLNRVNSSYCPPFTNDTLL